MPSLLKSPAVMEYPPPSTALVRGACSPGMPLLTAWASVEKPPIESIVTETGYAPMSVNRWSARTSKVLAPVCVTVPTDVAVPSPHSIVAVNSSAEPDGLSSAKVATTPLKGTPSNALIAATSATKAASSMVANRPVAIVAAVAPSASSKAVACVPPLDNTSMARTAPLASADSNGVAPLSPSSCTANVEPKSWSIGAVTMSPERRRSKAMRLPNVSACESRLSCSPLPSSTSVLMSPWALPSSAALT